MKYLYPLILLFVTPVVYGDNCIVISSPVGQTADTLTAAWNKLDANGTLTIHPGEYVLNKPLYWVGKPFNLVARGVVFLSMSPNDETILTVGSDLKGVSQHGGIIGLSITAGGKTWWEGGPKKTGLFAQNVVWWHFEDLDIRTCHTAIELHADGAGYCVSNRFDIGNVSNFKTGFKISRVRNDKIWAWANANSIYGGNWCVNSFVFTNQPLLEVKFFDFQDAGYGTAIRDCCLQSGGYKNTNKVWWIDSNEIFASGINRCRFEPAWLEAEPTIPPLLRCPNADFSDMSKRFPGSFRPFGD